MVMYNISSPPIENGGYQFSCVDVVVLDIVLWTGWLALGLILATLIRLILSVLTVVVVP